MDNKNKSLILIDESNIYYGFKDFDWKLDYQRFYKWLHRTFNPINTYIYGGLITLKAYLDKHPKEKESHEKDYNYIPKGFVDEKERRIKFFKKLRSMGYEINSKPVSSIYDKMNGTYKRKCNFDVEITITAIDKLQQYSEFILCSGDGDFIKLLKYLKNKAKKTILIMIKKDRNKNLQKIANQTIYFKDIKEDVEKK